MAISYDLKIATGGHLEFQPRDVRDVHNEFSDSRQFSENIDLLQSIIL